MTGHEYLQNILSGQDLGYNELNQLRSLREQIEGVLRTRYGSTPRFYYAGSYGKKTMIKEAYDLDIVMYFSSNTNSTVKEIYNSVVQTLRNNGYIVQPKTVAIRLPYKAGFHIDVVPGRAQDETYYYATLYKNGEDTTMQTSIKKHIDTVKPVKDIVRLVKLWRLRQNISWETFALEQTIVRALTGLNKDDLAKSTMNVFTFIRDNIERVSIIDPANSNNEIAIPYNTRLLLKEKATSATQAQNWGQIIR
ncbi:MAG TPA: nucleotidyltransferase [Methylomirabilota bacterium]|nr:nucleotidyltransferase [Methylomirabilota bacterium]